MNLIGNLTRDPVFFNNNKTVIFDIAVSKGFKDQNGQYGSWFLDIKHFVQSEKQYEYFRNNFGVGLKVAIGGHIESYEDKNKHTHTSLVFDEVQPLQSRQAYQAQRANRSNNGQQYGGSQQYSNQPANNAPQHEAPQNNAPSNDAPAAGGNSQPAPQSNNDQQSTPDPTDGATKINMNDDDLPF